MTIYPQPIAIELTPRFQRDLRTLAKRYRNIRNDIQPVIEQLQAGELPGSRIPGMEYEIFKVRIKNSDIQKGKSAGYRAIYYLSPIRATIARIRRMKKQHPIANFTWLLVRSHIIPSSLKMRFN
ncbi:MAG: hypothetical protein EAZ09_23650 [Oscillatoriales cyanobacterium]|nr:MAG: hypothetical protein EAZ09_23650 [Oscillatoriales cyanobacterium]